MSKERMKMPVSSEELYFVVRNAELIMQLADRILPECSQKVECRESERRSEERSFEHPEQEQRASP